MLAKGSRAVPELRQPPRAEPDDVTFDQSQRILCIMTLSCSVADVALSGFDLRTTCMCTCAKAILRRAAGALGSGPRSLVCARNTRINEPPVPKADRRTLLLEGGAAESGSLGVRKPPAECYVNKRNTLETVTEGWCKKGMSGCGTAGWSKAERCIFGTAYCTSVVQRTGIGCACQRHAARLARATGIL